MVVSWSAHAHLYVECNNITVFIHVKITITCLFFIFRRAQSILCVLNIIRNQSFVFTYRFLITQIRYVVDFRFLRFNFVFTRPIVSLMCPSFSLTPHLTPLVCRWISPFILISLVIFFIMKKKASGGSLRSCSLL